MEEKVNLLTKQNLKDLRAELEDLKVNKRKEIAAKEQMLQERSIKEYKLAQWELAKTANRLRVKRRNRI